MTGNESSDDPTRSFYSAPKSASPDLIGQIIGPYEVLARLGSGGMGEVYSARHRRLRRLVALKVIIARKAGDRRMRELLLREARAVSALNHPNIVTLHDILEDGERDVVVMELVEGRTLTKRIPAGGMPVRQAIDIALEVAGAVESAHGKGIIHRDLKPSNVMVTSEGRSKVMDFGLAKLVTPRDAGPEVPTVSQFTLDGVILGTPGYMSPEQAMGRDVDARTDVFSLGAILYTMLAGAEPFAGDSVVERIHAVCYEDPPPLPDLRPDLPAPVLDTLRRALAKDRETRYGSMKAFRESLSAVRDQLAAESASSQLATHTVAETPPEESPTRSSPGFRAGAVLVAIAVVVFAVLAFLPDVRKTALGWFNLTADSGTEAGLDRNATSAELIAAAEAAMANLDEPEQLELAIRLFERAVAADPTLATAHAGLAEARFEDFQGNEDRALLHRADQSARESIRLDEYLAAGHAIHGRILGLEGRYEDAVASLERARMLDPLDPEAHLGLGEVAFAQQRFEEAEAFYAKAIELAPDEWRFHSQMAGFLFRRARYDDAEKAVRQWLSLAPRSVYGLQTLAAILVQQGHREEAAAALQEALKIRPEANVYSNLGTVLYFEGRYSEAAKAYERAVALKPNERLFWANLGDAYRAIAGQSSKAQDAYLTAVQFVRESLKTKPNDTVLLGVLAELQAKRGDRQDALETLSRVESLAKDEPGVWFAAVKAYEISGERDKALAALARSLQSGYSVAEIRSEQELVELRRDVRFHRLISPYEAGTSP